MSSNCTLPNQSNSTQLENGIFIGINCLLIVFICSGNIMTMLAVWRTPILRTVPNMYIVSLAAADFLAGAGLILQVFIFIPSLANTLNRQKNFCLTRHVTFFASVCTSVVSMVGIAFDRAFYIGYPLHYQDIMTTRRAKFIIAAIWVFSLFVGTVPYYVNNWDECHNCSIFYVLKKEYQVYILCSLFLVCCSLIVCCYGYIIKIARYQQKCIAEVDITNTKSRQFSKDVRLIKLFGLVFGIFFVCWAPALLSVSIGHLGAAVPQMVTNITVPMGLFNCGMNFIVYAVKNKDFRRAFAKMVCSERTKLNLVGPTETYPD